ASAVSFTSAQLAPNCGRVTPNLMGRAMARPLSPAPGLRQGGVELVAERRVRRVDGDALLEDGHGLGGAAERHQRDTEIVIRLEVGGVDRDRLPKLRGPVLVPLRL